jgi:hypothetical protein
MSASSQASVDCSSCGKGFTATTWDSLNAELNPEEARRVVDGSLFHFECPHCRAGGEFQYTLLFHDMRHQRMVWFFEDPEKANTDFLDTPLRMFGATGSQYQLRLTGNHSRLRELASIWLDGLDDVGILLSKVVMAGLFHERDGVEIRNAWFLRRDGDGNIVFAVETANGSMGDATLPKEIYEQNMESLVEFRDQIFPPNKWTGWTPEQAFDLMHLMSGESLEPVEAAPSPPSKKKPGLLGRLFGRG